MRIRSNLKRIFNFCINRRSEIFTPQFWATAKRVFMARFFILRKIPEKDFMDNLRSIEQRPWNLHIELTNICNADCIFCAYRFMSRKKTVMAQQVYTKALSDYAAIGGGELRLETCLGDPFCDPDFIARLRQARKFKQITKITVLTNGIGLSRVDLEEFLSCGIDELGISSGPWDEELYKQIYRTSGYHLMRGNVSALLKKNAGLKKPMRIKILFRSNLGMQKTLSLPDYEAIKGLPHEVEFNTDFDTWLGEISQKDLPAGMFLRPMAPHEKEPCYWLYDGPIVFADGSVGLCGCRDFNADSELILGNIMQDSLLSLWRSKKAARLRERFWKGDFPEICAKCTAYANLDLYRSAEGKKRAEFIKKLTQIKNTR